MKPKLQSGTSLIIRAGLIAALGTMAGSAFGTNYQWIGSSGSWGDASNWSPNGVPDSTSWEDVDSANLTFADSTDRVIFGLGRVARLTIGNSGTGQVIWNVSEGGGHPYTGNFNFWIGSGTVLNMTGGSLTTDPNEYSRVDLGTTVNLSGGSLNGGNLLALGGTLNLSGTGSIGGFQIGNSGLLYQSGGTASTWYFYNYVFDSGTASFVTFCRNSGQMSLGDGARLACGTFNLFGTLSLSTGSEFVCTDMNFFDAATLNISGTHQINRITGLSLSGNDVLNIQGDATAFLYYDPAFEENDYLGGEIYNLVNGGFLVPIPEPSAFALTTLGFLIFIMGNRTKVGRSPIQARQGELPSERRGHPPRGGI
jgi:hypothetical protein